ncbi:hypothetical protein NDU88_001058 [Pleurodeles waltl]|uniref:Uncharacterized protein n=1 Tax=Pleurodeles waltl TaxID=8319 RepID=A0AAV7KSF8_PLEWA|nr:hypothetical protein NDU88_001058 [Pleurodeles waltl]
MTLTFGPNHEQRHENPSKAVTSLVQLTPFINLLLTPETPVIQRFTLRLCEYCNNPNTVSLCQTSNVE